MRARDVHAVPCDLIIRDAVISSVKYYPSLMAFLGLNILAIFTIPLPIFQCPVREHVLQAAG